MADNATAFARKRRLSSLESKAKSVQKQLKDIDDHIAVVERQEKAREDFFYFCKEVMSFRELYEPLHRPLCELIADSRIKRKLILLPRGHFKTTIISICFPLWRLVRNQNERISLCSAAAGKAEESLEEIIDRAKRDRFQLLCGDSVKRTDQWLRCTRTQIRIPRTGSTTGPSIAAYGTDSSEVGRHFSVMLLDDVVNQETINTISSRDSSWSWLGRQLSVLDPGSEMLVIGTRWHWDDVYSRIQRQLPCYTKEEKDKLLHGEELPIKWWVEKRKVIEDGKLIFPTRFSREELDQIKQIQGDYIFSCFYYNEPVGEGVNPYDLKKFQWVPYKEPEDCESEEDQIQTPFTHIFVDPASSDADTACFSGIVVCDALWTHQVVVKEAFLEKHHPDALIDRLFELSYKYQPIRVCIEDEAYQRSLVHWMKREMAMRDISFQILQIKIPRNVRKFARLDALQPFIHNGEIIFREDMEGRTHVIEEFEAYPKGPHLDLIAAMNMIPHAVIYPPRRRLIAPKPDVPPAQEFLERLINKHKRRRGYMPRVKVRQRA